MDEVQEYSSAVFHIDGSEEENLLSFLENQGQSFPGLQHLPREFYSFQQQVRLVSVLSVQQGAS